jgi:hypothetical protein
MHKHLAVANLASVCRCGDRAHHEVHLAPARTRTAHAWCAARRCRSGCGPRARRRSRRRCGAHTRVACRAVSEARRTHAPHDHDVNPALLHQVRERVLCAPIALLAACGVRGACCGAAVSAKQCACVACTRCRPAAARRSARGRRPHPPRPCSSPPCMPTPRTGEAVMPRMPASPSALITYGRRQGRTMASTRKNCTCVRAPHMARVCVCLSVCGARVAAQVAVCVCVCVCVCVRVCVCVCASCCLPLSQVRADAARAALAPASHLETPTGRTRWRRGPCSWQRRAPWPWLCGWRRRRGGKKREQRERTCRPCARRFTRVRTRQAPTTAHQPGRGTGCVAAAAGVAARGAWGVSQRRHRCIDIGVSVAAGTAAGARGARGAWRAALRCFAHPPRLIVAPLLLACASIVSGCGDRCTS